MNSPALQASLPVKIIRHSGQMSNLKTAAGLAAFSFRQGDKAMGQRTACKIMCIDHMAHGFKAEERRILTGRTMHSHSNVLLAHQLFTSMWTALPRRPL